MPRVIVLVENLTFLVLSLYLYYVFQGNWIVLVVLFLTPDLSMIGYLINPKIGSYIYNSVHNYVLPILLLIIAGFLINDILAQIGFIIMAHVALDRLLGFGLKYPTHFKQTHLQKL